MHISNNLVLLIRVLNNNNEKPKITQVKVYSTDLVLISNKIEIMDSFNLQQCLKLHIIRIILQMQLRISSQIYLEPRVTLIQNRKVK
jgi:hypothetical protein